MYAGYSSSRFSHRQLVAKVQKTFLAVVWVIALKNQLDAFAANSLVILNKFALLSVWNPCNFQTLVL